MRITSITMLLVAFSSITVATTASAEERKNMVAIAIHGGAGVIPRDQLGPDDGASYRAGLAEALDAGYAVLAAGGNSLDAVTTAVRLLEDNPLFNAGKGAVLAHDGYAELDASIMEGRTLAAGAVTGLRHVKNPIDLARRVMENSPHVFLSGTGAEEFALTQDLTLVPNEYFVTPTRKRQLERVLQGRVQARNELQGLGTVGAVAVDAQGNIAAATSTGGMTNKRWGRIGDAPVIGAGTYANNASCAVSATGHGEYFIRSVVAYDICALVEYRGWTLEKAAKEVVHGKLIQRGGEGGIIAVDPQGNVVMQFNSPGMFRGMRDSAGRREIAIYEK
ncbi:MAG: isoaspartyl peptidase/L-asparaginase [Gammaproteobacteria bacterium]|nr:isoaspartyl peptidase/L-asparaginase [Gammaproteobacteria bacterium]MBM4209335.1 isoaspartyl peptidase/L-asparaginase [Gammaproteobacteria bacterium]MBM4230622.1 isoaspartyl peptidase/L-asparaginase [Gammaproteobacteria bacterium]